MVHGVSIRKFGVLLVFLLHLSGVIAGENLSAPTPGTRGSTSPQPADLSGPEIIDETARTVVVSRSAMGAEATTSKPRAVIDPAWSLVQDLAVFSRLAKGERFAVRFDSTNSTLVALQPTDVLTAKARQAVQRAPVWLQRALEDQFAQMATTQQDLWAQKVLDAADPQVDETAFLIAHIAKEDLAGTSFNGQLINDQAGYAYEVDPFLDYVRVVDHGSAATGGDYFSSLEYQVDLDGTTQTIELPKELYYWYVIHPRESDEPPLYIDPATCSSGGTPAAPPTGKFWSRWFFYGASNKFGNKCDIHWDGSRSEDCPLLKGMLTGVTKLWAHLNNTSGPTNGAIGMVNEWVRQSLGPFGDKDGCRPVQPVTVYYHGDGNCGEWADLTAAAARAALIPIDNTETRVNDHVFNYFFDPVWNRWVQWEPVNNMINSDYSGWWSGRIAATNTYRGDGYGHTDRTPLNGPAATLVVTVYDKNHYPVDGAEVTLGSNHDTLPLIYTATEGHANAQGQVTFEVGDSRDYYVKVKTRWGAYPTSGWAKVITNAVGDTTYQWSPPDFSGTVPRLSVTDAGPGGTHDDFLIEVQGRVDEGYVHGTSIVSPINFIKEWPGDLDFFIADLTNWNLFTSGSAFQARGIAIDSRDQALSFVIPDSGDFYVTWSNTAANNMSEALRGNVRLYTNSGGVPPVTALMVSKSATGAANLEWEDVSGQNVSGYNVYRSTAAAHVGQGQDQAALAPYLLAATVDSQLTDADPTAPGQCFFYSVRTKSKRGGISP